MSTRSAATWLLWIALVSLGGCATPKPVYSTAPGPYEVKVAHLTLPAGPTSTRDVPLRVAYPAGANGPLPVVVYSHGMACGYDNYAAVQDDWVSHGYVVLSPAHLDELSAGRTFGLDSGALLISTRLTEVSLALDSIGLIENQVPELKGRLDARRAAIAGHSFGGMIAQIKAGLTLKDFKGGPEPLSFRDPRFVAAVIMSGVGPMPQMTDDAFSKLTLPLFASGGTEDLGATGAGPVQPWRWRLGAYDLAPAGDKYAVWLKGGDHYLGGLICRSDRVNKPDPGGAAAVAATSRLFLDAYLKNDRKAREFLAHADLGALTDGRATLERK